MAPTTLSGFGEQHVLFRHGHGVDVAFLPATLASALPPELDEALRCGFKADRAEVLRCLEAIAA